MKERKFDPQELRYYAVRVIEVSKAEKEFPRTAVILGDASSYKKALALAFQLAAKHATERMSLFEETGGWEGRVSIQLRMGYRIRNSGRIVIRYNDIPSGWSIWDHDSDQFAVIDDRDIQPNSTYWTDIIDQRVTRSESE